MEVGTFEAERAYSVERVRIEPVDDQNGISLFRSVAGPKGAQIFRRSHPKKPGRGQQVAPAEVVPKQDLVRSGQRQTHARLEDAHAWECGRASVSGLTERREFGGIAARGVEEAVGEHAAACFALRAAARCQPHRLGAREWMRFVGERGEQFNLAAAMVE